MSLHCFAFFWAALKVMPIYEKNQNLFLSCEHHALIPKQATTVTAATTIASRLA